MGRKQVTISMPEWMQQYVEDRVKADEYVTVSEYIRDLIKQDKHRELGRLGAAARYPESPRARQILASAARRK